MTAPNPKCFHLSASAIASFKACPTRFRLGYREGLRQDEDTEAQRMGSNWHAMHEAYQNALTRNNLPEDVVDDEDHAIHAASCAWDAVVAHLNERYEQVPPTVDPEDWAVERQTLLVSFMGYLWYYEDDPLEFLSSEVRFDLPLYTPKRGMPLPKSQALRVGMIDTVIRWRGMVGNREMKSTSRSIDPSGDYWERAQKDTQVSMYALAFRDMRREGLEQYGISGVEDDERVGNTLYDVWRRPTMKPKMLTQKDTAALLETGKYLDVDFKVLVRKETDIDIDGHPATIEFGKSGKPAIRETPEMFGVRLLADIYERPEYYFQRKEIARTDRDLNRFSVELFNIYQAMRMFDQTGCWYENEQQCRATFPCEYIPVCYGPGADAVCDGETTPQGFQRKFTDVTIGATNGNETTE